MFGIKIIRYIDIKDIKSGDVLAIGKNGHFITVSKILETINGNEPYYIFIYFENGYWHEVNQEYVQYRIVSWAENDDYLVEKVEK